LCPTRDELSGSRRKVGFARPAGRKAAQGLVKVEKVHGGVASKPYVKSGPKKAGLKKDVPQGKSGSLKPGRGKVFSSRRKWGKDR